jgi:mannitol-1-phosphate/altronate dehydrogenase
MPDDPQREALQAIARSPEAAKAARAMIAQAAIFGDLAESEKLVQQAGAALEHLRTLGSMGALQRLRSA